jgi:hypothetical protein
MYVLCNYLLIVSSVELKLCLKDSAVVFEVPQLSGTDTDRQKYSAFEWSLGLLYC